MTSNTTVLIPAGMKPMHGGHIDLIKRYSNHPDVKEINVIIGPASRENIDQPLAIDIAKFLTRNIEKVNIIETSYPTPVTALYKYMENVTCGNYAVGASYKSNDYKTVLKFVENFNKGGKYENALPECVNAVELNLDFNPILYKGRNDEFNGLPLSATVVRKAIDNEDLTDFLLSYPDTPLEDATVVWNMIIARTKNSANLHMEHLEDLMFNNGLCGIVKCKTLFTKMLNTLAKEKEEINITTKYDGSPSVFCWSKFPGLSDNGIAIKGLFNKNPETFNSITDIVDSTKPLDLQRKLVRLFNRLPELKIPEGEIWQGDILYDIESLHIEDINGYPALSFHSNIILYSPKSMLDYIRIKNSKLGMVWHTIYLGSSLDTVKCHYDINIGKLGHVPDIFMINHKIEYNSLNVIDVTYTNDIDYISTISYFINDQTYLELISNKEFVKYLTLFYNDIIKENYIVSSHKFVGNFKNYVKNRFINIIESKKLQVTQLKYQKQCDDLIILIEDHRFLLNRLHFTMNKLTGIKTLFINELNKYSTIYTHFKTFDDKFIETNHEGYVINDTYHCVKLINRSEFSYTNFSEDFIRGWNNEKRTI